MAGRLANKRIIITGAADNIGKEAVKAFVAEGARVVIGDINEAKGQATAKELGTNAHFLKVDLTNDGSIEALIEAGVAWLGGLDVLCQNAGVQIAGPLADATVEQWDRMFVVL